MSPPRRDRGHGPLLGASTPTPRIVYRPLPSGPYAPRPQQGLPARASGGAPPEPGLHGRQPAPGRRPASPLRLAHGGVADRLPSLCRSPRAIERENARSSAGPASRRLGARVRLALPHRRGALKPPHDGRTVYWRATAADGKCDEDPDHHRGERQVLSHWARSGARPAHGAHGAYDEAHGFRHLSGAGRGTSS